MRCEESLTAEVCTSATVFAPRELPTNEVMRRAKEALVRLVEKTEQTRDSRELREYLSFLAKFRRYSACNTWLILSQRPHATKVRGFKQWRELGRYVRQGEKGIMILAPQFKEITEKVKKPKTDEQTGQPLVNPITGQVEYEEVEEKHTITWFRPVYVFDIAQTQGKPFPQLDLTAKGVSILPQLLSLTEKEQIPISFENMKEGSYGYIDRSKGIAVKADLDDTTKCSVLIHEIAHKKLRHLDQKGKIPLSQIETEAEAVAFAVCDYFGIDSSSDIYLSIWQKDSNRILEAYDRIKDTIANIIEALEAPALAPVPIAQ